MPRSKVAHKVKWTPWEGYLSQEGRVVDGRTRKYYAITDKGRDALDEARRKIAELVNEILEEQGR